MITRFYKIYNKEDKVVYVGITTRSVNQRFKEHVFYKKLNKSEYYCKEFYKLNHGNIKNLTDYFRERKKVVKLERKFIKDEKNNGNTLLNISSGGEWLTDLLRKLQETEFFNKYGKDGDFEKYLFCKKQYRIWLNDWIRNKIIYKIWLSNWINHRIIHNYKKWLSNWISNVSVNKYYKMLNHWIGHKKTNNYKRLLNNWIKSKEKNYKTLLNKWIDRSLKNKYREWLRNFIVNKSMNRYERLLYNFIFTKEKSKYKGWINHWISHRIENRYKKLLNYMIISHLKGK